MAGLDNLSWVSRTTLQRGYEYLDTKTGDRCSDSWTSSEIELARALMATENLAYGFIPLDQLKEAFVSLRKNKRK